MTGKVTLILLINVKNKCCLLAPINLINKHVIFCLVDTYNNNYEETVLDHFLARGGDFLDTAAESHMLLFFFTLFLFELNKINIKLLLVRFRRIFSPMFVKNQASCSSSLPVFMLS